MTARAMSARFAGACRCGARVTRGDQIRWERIGGVIECPGCRDGAQTAADRFDQQVEDNMAAAAGVGENDPGRW
jgi:hypothetical protein